MPREQPKQNKKPQAIKWMTERMVVIIGVKSSVFFFFLPKNKSFEKVFKVTERLPSL